MDLKQLKDIQLCKEKVVTRCQELKRLAFNKRSQLDSSRQYQYFERDAKELKLWIKEKLIIASYASYDRTNVKSKLENHKQIEAEVSAYNAIEKIDETASELLKQNHFASNAIKHRLDEVRSLLDELRSTLGDKMLKLEQDQVFVEFLRQCDEVIFWIKEKEAYLSTYELLTLENLNLIEVLEKKLDQFIKDMETQESKVNEQATKLMNELHSEKETINTKIKDVHDACQRMKVLAEMKKKQLYIAREIQFFITEANETLSSLQEKFLVLSSRDNGQDLASIQTLKGNHAIIEKDLDVLKNKIVKLNEDGKMLINLNPGFSSIIKSKYGEVSSNWDKLKLKAIERSEFLDEAYAYQQFLTDVGDLVSSICDLKNAIKGDKLAKDVAGAEALLKKHKDYKDGMDTKTDQINRAIQAGKTLQDQGIAVKEVEEKLLALTTEFNSLILLWDEREVAYRQWRDVQLFYRDFEEADAWMSQYEAFLRNEELGDSITSVEALIKKEEDFEKSLLVEEEKIEALTELAEKVIKDFQDASEDLFQEACNKPTPGDTDDDI